MFARTITKLLFIIFASAWIISGCAKNDNNPAGSGGGSWTISGKTYLVGAPEPVSGVAISCAGVKAISGADGSYELPGIPEGTQIVTAQKAQCDSFSRSIEVHSGMSYQIYLKHSDATISGVVRNSLGEPVANAKVTLREYTDYTDEAGQYRFSNISRGSVDTLYVTHPDYVATQVTCSLNAPEIHLNVLLTKEWTIVGLITRDLYVDETLPSSMMYYSTQLLLGTAGLDSLGRYKFSHRNILINFDLPELLRNDSVTVLDANLELRTDAAYPSFSYQAFTISAPWDYYATYNNQPAIGPMIASGTVGDGSPSKYWSVLGISGIRQIIAGWKAGARFYGVEIQGGIVAGRGFYSSRSTAGNRPKISFKVRY